MNYDLEFGKSHTKRKKKILDSMSLVKLKSLAKKYKISCYKKGTKTCVKKSTLLKRLKQNRSINKILESAEKMKKTKKRKSKFGNGLLESKTGKTYSKLSEHYDSIPNTLISKNFPQPLKYTRGSLGKSSLPPYYNNFGQYFH